ncbi:MAG: HIT domain-containing protein [Planctomycetes bacterium]|nr:HIT domain-containing protein [Planctomycetota bacterium]
MDRLWAPWRLAYVAAAKPPAEHDPCFICKGLSEQADRENLIAWRGPASVVVLNRFPYNNGHLLVAPKAHKAELHDLDAGEIAELHQTLARMVTILRESMKPDGFNIGLNLGKAAGAGLPGHLHWHIVPRWFGDTNFMPVFSDTRVMVQSLDQFFVFLTERLKESN